MVKDLFGRKNRHNNRNYANVKHNDHKEIPALLEDDTDDDYIIAKAMHNIEPKNVFSTYLNCTHIESPIDTSVLFGQDDDGNYFAGVSVVPNNLDMIEDFTVYDKNMNPICSKEDIGLIGMVVKEEGINPLIDNFNACLSELNLNFNCASRVTRTLSEGYWVNEGNL